MGKLLSYLVTDKILVFVTVNFSVLLKHTVLDTCTHEVEIALAGCKAATHSGSWLPTMVTALEMKETLRVNHFNQSDNLFSRQFITSTHYPGNLTRWRPLETALCTCRRAPFSSYTSADHKEQFTWAHSFCPMYNNRPASCGIKKHPNVATQFHRKTH